MCSGKFDKTIRFSGNAMEFKLLAGSGQPFKRANLSAEYTDGISLNNSTSRPLFPIFVFLYFVNFRVIQSRLIYSPIKKL